jgi:hypothetical protein
VALEEEAVMIGDATTKGFNEHLAACFETTAA